MTVLDEYVRRMRLLLSERDDGLISDAEDDAAVAKLDALLDRMTPEERASLDKVDWEAA